MAKKTRYPRLRPIVADIPDDKIWCGPAALAAITGAPVSRANRAILEHRAEHGRSKSAKKRLRDGTFMTEGIGGVTHAEFVGGASRLGKRMVYVNAFGRKTVWQAIVFLDAMRRSRLFTAQRLVFVLATRWHFQALEVSKRGVRFSDAWHLSGVPASEIADRKKNKRLVCAWIVAPAGKRSGR